MSQITTVYYKLVCESTWQDPFVQSPLCAALLKKKVAQETFIYQAVAFLSPGELSSCPLKY